MTKKEAFLVLDAVYGITGGSSAEIERCRDCKGCPCETLEAGEYVTLLPYEAEYIYNRLRNAGREHLASLVHKISEPGICPFLKQGRCSIHDVRPIDCRSYPMVPQFEGTKMHFAVSKMCPYWTEIGGQFVRLFKRAWLILGPLLNEPWCKGYALRNQAPVERVPVCTSRVDEVG